ncbi:helix-turn-helix domain-containing protein [Aquipseudomonas alcaligenes]
MAKFRDFPERLVWFRSGAGITQRELAERSGVSLPQITRYESGKSAPRLAAVMKIARALGVPVEEFTADKTSEPLKKMRLVGEDGVDRPDDVTFMIPEGLIDQIEQGAQEKGITFEEAFNNLLENMLKKELEELLPPKSEAAQPATQAGRKIKAPKRDPN